MINKKDIANLGYRIFMAVILTIMVLCAVSTGIVFYESILGTSQFQ